MPPIVLTPIGRIRTRFRTIAECPRAVGDDAEPCRVEVLPIYADALQGIEAASHVWLLYWLDLAERSLLKVTTPHDGVVRGVFANRSPARPNPVAIKAVRLYGIDPHGTDPRAPTSLMVGGMDCLDGTPLLDIKPYLPLADHIQSATLSWLR